MKWVNILITWAFVVKIKGGRMVRPQKYADWKQLLPRLIPDCLRKRRCSELMRSTIPFFFVIIIIKTITKNLVVLGWINYTNKASIKAKHIW